MSPDHIYGLAAAVKRKPAHRGVLSTGERLAVALVLDKPAYLKEEGYTALEAVKRVSGGGWPLEWLLEAQKMLRSHV